jgi:hypothetical protein
LQRKTSGSRTRRQDKSIKQSNVSMFMAAKKSAAVDRSSTNIAMESTNKIKKDSR